MPPEMSNDVWTLGDLLWHGLIGAGGLLSLGMVGLVRKVYMLDKENVKTKTDIEYLKKGQDKLNDNMDTAVEHLTVIKTIVDARKNASLTNVHKRRDGEDE